MKKHHPKILISLVITAILFLGYVQIAHAAIIEAIGTGLITLTIGLIMYILGYIGSLLVTLGGGLASWSLDLNNTLLTSAIVEKGWVIARDLANLGFVLAIILISFTTILRIQQYETKKMLTNLIIAALLINFSLIIAGVFIDFSGMLTDFFISKAGGGSPTELRNALVASFQVQTVLSPPDLDAGKFQELIGGLKNKLSSAISFVANLFFIVIYTFTAAIALFGLAAMFFIRYIVLIILLILMPLAWLFMILPDTAHLWKKWWEVFMRWIFFAPTASFFIYLALSIPTSGQNFTVGVDLPINESLLIPNFGQLIGQMIAVIGLLIGGMMVADKVGTEVGLSSIALGRRAKNMAIGATGKMVGGGVRRVLQTGYRPERVDPKTGKVIPGGNIIQRTASRLIGIPGMSTVHQWATAGQKTRQDAIRKEYNQLAKEDVPGFLARATAATMRDDVVAAQIIKTAADHDLLGDLEKKNPVALEMGIQAARRQGTEKALYKKDPRLAMMARPQNEDPNIAKAEVITAMNTMAPKDLGALPAEALELPEIALNFTNPQLKYIAINATGEQEVAMEKTLNKWKKEEATNGAEWQALTTEMKNTFSRGIVKLDRLVNENLAATVPKGGTPQMQQSIVTAGTPVGNVRSTTKFSTP